MLAFPRYRLEDRRYAPRVSVEESATSGEQRKLRFLVVDDSEDIRDVMSRMIEMLGHEVEEAADGQYAVEMLQQSTYDIMLLDLSMPRMTGEDVVRWIRENPPYGENMRIVVVSAWSGSQRPVLNELGVTEVLPKPFRRQQLIDLLS